MISRDEMIQAIQHEYRIIRHLHSKIPAESYDYKPSEKQRTLRQVLGFLVHGPAVCARVLSTGDQSLFGKMDEDIKVYSEANFLADLEAAEKEVVDNVRSVSDEKLNEEIQVFGVTMKRSSWYLNLILEGLVAYRMQVFLYLKVAGRPELNTANLWLARDANPGETF